MTCIVQHCIVLLRWDGARRAPYMRFVGDQLRRKVKGKKKRQQKTNFLFGTIRFFSGR
jgi:hypothetical protein